MTRKDNISELVPEDVSQMEYKPVTDWRISMVKELIDVKWGQAVNDNISSIEIEDICTSYA